MQLESVEMSDETEMNDYSESISTKIPDWIIEDDDDEEELKYQGFSKEEIVKANMPQSQENSRGSPLEQLAPDLSAVVLQHLTVQEIATVSTISKALLVAARNSRLWKLQFESRWNLDMEEEDWCHSCAEEHVRIAHDLWMTHWNCVSPDNGLSPGRSCMPHRSHIVIYVPLVAISKIRHHNPTFSEYPRLHKR